MLQPYQQRVVEEKNALDSKREALRAFTQGPIFPTLTPLEQQLLNEQSALMDQYSAVLGRRIGIFNTQPDAKTPS